MKGKLIIFSAPSGSGKTTIVKYLAKNNSNLVFAISACTRDKRGRTEKDGVDYYFLTPEEFKTKIDNNEFVEWEEVYDGAFYGTLISELERIWNEGNHVLLDLDVKGGMNVKKYYGDSTLAVFVRSPSYDVFTKRLMDRKTDSEDSISRRIFKAKFELKFENMFDVTLVNDVLEDTLKKAQEIVDEFLES